MTPSLFLLLNLALAFYNVGTIWAHEVDIFRSWELIGESEFHQVQRAHFRKVPYWISAPVGIALLGSIVLLRYHPEGSPLWIAWGVLICQILSMVLTGMFWGRWQARLARDPQGPKSIFLGRILKTHWIRTALINAYAFLILVWVAGGYSR
jgi:hypothetical protein